jgi:hypothetical protein
MIMRNLRLRRNTSWIADNSGVCSDDPNPSAFSEVRREILGRMMASIFPDTQIQFPDTA